MSNKIELHKSKVQSIHNEEWKDITGYEGLYMVSNFGNIKSLDRLALNTKTGFSFRVKGILRKKVTHKKGYDQVMLSKDGMLKLTLVHRIVASEFIENTDRKPEVNHINGVKTDNRSCNLEWCTSQENENHSRDTYLNTNYNIILDTTTGIFFNSFTEAAFAYNKNRLTLKRTIMGVHVKSPIKNITNLILA